VYYTAAGENAERAMLAAFKSRFARGELRRDFSMSLNEREIVRPSQSRRRDLVTSRPLLEGPRAVPTTSSCQGVSHDPRIEVPIHASRPDDAERRFIELSNECTTAA